MFNTQVTVNDIVEFVSDLDIMNTGIIAHISSDPDMKPYLVRTAQGEECRIVYDQITGIVQTAALDGLISLYILQQFGRYKQHELTDRVTFEIKGEASYSSKELAIKHEVTLGYGKSFVSSSLATSLDHIILRDQEDKRYAVKALPAS